MKFMKHGKRADDIASLITKATKVDFADFEYLIWLPLNRMFNLFPLISNILECKT